MKTVIKEGIELTKLSEHQILKVIMDHIKVITLLVFVTLIGSAFALKTGSISDKNENDYTNDGIEIKGEVKEIIENKCMGCHNPKARNEKARKKLQWSDVPEMNTEEQKDLINELYEVLEDGKMPPKKAIERRPKMKLTDEETKTLLTWVEKEDKRLRGK